MAANYAIDILKSNEADILRDWLLDLQAGGWGEGGRFSQGSDWQGQAKELLRLIVDSARGGMEVPTLLPGFEHLALREEGSSDVDNA